MKTRKSTAIAAALGGVAAAGAGADPADAMLPADAGGGTPPATSQPETAAGETGPVKTGHPTQGQAETEVPAPPPPRVVNPTPAVNPYANKPKVGPAGDQTPVVDRGARGPGGRQGGRAVNPTRDKPKVLPDGEQETPAPVNSPPPANTTPPSNGSEPTPEDLKARHDATRATDAHRYANALDQIEENGGALNQGLANTLNEFRDRPGVRRQAGAIREARDEREEDLDEGDLLPVEEPGRYGLRRNDEPTGQGSALDDLRDRYPHASLDEVLADGNRKTRDLPDDNDALDGVPDPDGYRFNEGDDDTDHWHPQGITGDEDMHVVSWWGQPGGDGPTDRGRVSFVNRENGTYRHALLVQPTGGGEFDQVNTHAGGTVKRGDLLYVAETSDGLSVYDTSMMVRVDDDEQDADGYKYLLPRVASYDNVGERMRFSTLSVDDSGPGAPALVVGEYQEHEGVRTHVARWELGPDGLPASESASDVWETGKTHVQGVAMRDGKVYMASSAPEGSTGELYSGYPGFTGLNTTFPWSDGVESLQTEDDRLYTVTEHPGKRMVHGSPLDEY